MTILAEVAKFVAHAGTDVLWVQDPTVESLLLRLSK
jgi:hypothetical protein